jgi:exodeoxyribonuclease-3
VLCLQELKATEEVFPFDSVQSAGYHAAVFGQKTYNGVAILSRSEPSAVVRGMEDDVPDPQVRLISAEIDGVRIICAYVPNGQSVGSEKYAYKLQWLRRLREHLDRRFDASDAVVLCGDFNVALDDRDVAHPDQWADSVLCHQAARGALAEVRRWGLVDVVRKFHPQGGVYSWWDYRMLAFPKNNGLRIDHIFATEPMASRCTGAEIDRAQRKGQKPSDHAPVIAVFGP